MSVEVTCKTKISDEDALIEAVNAIIGKGRCIKAKAETEVRGYISRKKPTILVNLPGLYGTAGFCKNKDGNYEMVYDSMDRYKLGKLIPQKRGEITHDVLAQTYSKLKLQKGLKALRAKVTKDTIEADGSISIRARI